MSCPYKFMHFTVIFSKIDFRGVTERLVDKYGDLGQADDRTTVPNKADEKAHCEIYNILVIFS